MHRLLLLRMPRRWWPPRMRPRWVQILRPVRRLLQRWQHKLRTIELRGLEHLHQAVAAGHGVLITPNHFAYADPFILFEAADRVRRPFYFMTAWEVFGASGPLRRLVLRQHGCFSVDREGADVRAFRQAVNILQERPHPLVIFPEGEMYHVNDRVMPFHDGAAAMALTAARRGRRPIVCLPASIKYHFLEDPTPQLDQLMDRLEQAVLGRPQRDLALPQRIYRLAEAALALKELEYLGESEARPLRRRIETLSDTILRRLEWDYDLEPGGAGIPERIKHLRQQALERLHHLATDDPLRQRCHQDLDDVFFVLQLYCYPAAYLSVRPSIERVAETLDKLEEDLLGVAVAPARAARAAVLTFGEPIPVEPSVAWKEAARALTRTLEQRVQALLDGTPVPGQGAIEFRAAPPVPGLRCAAPGALLPHPRGDSAA